VKMLLWKDVKLMEVKVGSEEARILQLTLKQPKTAKTMPVQLVEMPEVGGFLCPVTAYESWQRIRMSAKVGGKPVFMWRNGTMVTGRDINKMLGLLLPDEEPKIMTRAFRPALSTI
jgi:hypothetical protein